MFSMGRKVGRKLQVGKLSKLGIGQLSRLQGWALVGQDLVLG